MCFGCCCKLVFHQGDLSKCVSAIEYKMCNTVCILGRAIIEKFVGKFKGLGQSWEHIHF